MKKERKEEKMIDIYEANLEEYFKYLLERVNQFLNEESIYANKMKAQYKSHKDLSKK